MLEVQFDLFFGVDSVSSCWDAASEQLVVYGGRTDGMLAVFKGHESEWFDAGEVHSDLVETFQRHADHVHVNKPVLLIGRSL